MCAMGAATGRRAAVTITIAAVALAVFGAGLSAWAQGDGVGALTALTVAGFATVGGVLTLARPGNRVGWLMLAGAACWGFGGGLFDVALRSILTTPGPGASALAIVGLPLRAAGWLLVAIVVPVYFPDGRVRWRPLRWLVWALVVTSVAGTALDGVLENNALRAAGWHSPLVLPAPIAPLGDALATVSLPLMAASVIGAVAGFVSRWRAGPAPLRRQLLLFVVAAALPLLVIPTAFIAGLPSWLFLASVLPLAAAIAAAILTGGLFDLATVANRSLVWAALSGSVVIIYALVVAGTGALIGGASWLPWFGAGVVAVCSRRCGPPCRPPSTGSPTAGGASPTTCWRRWASGSRPPPTVAGCSPRWSPNCTRRSACGASRCWTRRRGGHRTAGGRGYPGGVDGLRAGGRHTVLCGAGTPLRAADRRLLDDLAAQLGGLLYAHALTGDLQRARERLVLAREEERRRLRRDLHDGLGPALAGLLLKVDTTRALVALDPAGRAEPAGPAGRCAGHRARRAPAGGGAAPTGPGRTRPGRRGHPGGRRLAGVGAPAVTIDIPEPLRRYRPRWKLPSTASSARRSATRCGTPGRAAVR